MNILPNPVCAFDIGADGAATPCAIDAPVGAGWRWLHFDMGDPALAGWLRDRVPDYVATALLMPETRPRFDERAEGVLVNLRGVNLNPDSAPEDMVAMRVWATSTQVITLRHRRIMAVDAIRKDIEGGNAPLSPAAFLAQIAEGLTRRIETVALTLEDRVDALEDAILAETTINPQDVLDLRQSLIKLKRFIGPQRDALYDFAFSNDGFLDEATALHLKETANRAARSVEALEADRDRMAALQDHLDTRSAATLGRNGYVLSIIAAIFLPLGFLTGLFGVNIAGMPGVETPRAFAALCVASVVLGLLLYLVFRFLKWL